ncbi:MAG: DUF4411 family protein [Pseudoclavibacter sp.]|nr:DUF4411 family protein [Pseudoclavibacter sp.]
MERAHREELICSIEAVRKELLAGKDELAEWAASRGDFFHPIDSEAQWHFEELTRWAFSQNFTETALENFTGNNADYLLVAYARGHRHIVVTHERSQPSSRKRVLIPDACKAMRVETVDTFQMLRASGARLELGGTAP